MTITDNEYDVLTAILNNEFQDGDDVTECHVWLYSVAHDCKHKYIQGRSFSGVISSLVKKGLIRVQNNDGHDDTVIMTQKGCKSQEATSICN